MNIIGRIKNMAQTISSSIASCIASRGERSEIKLKKASPINVNGTTYRGKTVVIENNQVMIDGNKVSSHDTLSIHLTVEITGDVEKVETMSGDVSITGNVQKATTMSGDIRSGGTIAKAETMSGDIISQSR